MSAREPITAWVDGIGLLAPGIGDWATGRALPAGDGVAIGQAHKRQLH